MRQRGGTTDMTRGAPAGLLLRVGLPLIAANTLQQVYAMVDTVILGRFEGVGGLAVLGVCSWPVWLQVSILTNFSQASSILAARYYGQKDAEALRAAVGSMYSMALVLCAAMMVALQAAARPLLVWQGAPPEMLEQGVAYLRILYAGTAVLFAYNLLAALLRAVGDGRTPLLAIAAAALVNVGLDVWFVAGLGLGAVGAAWATVIAQAASALVCLLRVRQIRELHIRRRHLRIRRSLLGDYMQLSVPMLMQSFVIAFGGFFVQSHINRYGAAFVAGMSATTKVFSLLETAAIALAQAAATFVSQNYGAQAFDRIRRGVRIAARISLGIAALLAAGMALGGRGILSLYVAEEAIDTSWGYLMVMSAGLFIMYPMYVLRQSLQALGNAVVPLIAALVQLLARVLVTVTLPQVMGSRGMYFPTVVAWITSLVLIGAVFPFWLRRCERRAGQRAS